MVRTRKLLLFSLGIAIAAAGTLHAQVHDAEKPDSEYLCDSRLLRSSMAWRIKDFFEGRLSVVEAPSVPPAAVEFIKYVNDAENRVANFTVRIRRAGEPETLPGAEDAPRNVQELLVSGQYASGLGEPKDPEWRIKFQVDQKNAAPTLASELGFGADGTLEVAMREIEPFLSYRPEDMSRVDFQSLPTDSHLLVVFTSGSGPPEVFVGRTPVEARIWPKGSYQFLIYQPGCVILDSEFELGNRRHIVSEVLKDAPNNPGGDDRDLTSDVEAFFKRRNQTVFERRDEAIRLMQIARGRLDHGK